MTVSAAGGTGVPADASTLTVVPATVTAAQRARLPLATTYATLRRAPRDPHPFDPESGLTAHPTVRQVIYVRPGGPPMAVLPTTELDEPTWVPVVESRPGWQRVLLPSRPNRSTGWLYLGDGGLRTAPNGYRVRIELGARRLTVFDGGQTIGSWKVAVGAPATPTPTGRTFLLAALSPAHPTYSPLFLVLGTHSTALARYGGGPATIALHGWPERTVFGHAVSHGCVRVPAAALHVLSRVPRGGAVMITA